MPADGWYEWAGEKDTRQPYFITPIDDQPIYLAGLSSVAPDADPQQGDGFVLVTSGTERGIVDVHASRLITLNASDARRWLNSKTTFAEAQKMVRDSLLPRELFRSFRVSVGVNCVDDNEPAYNDPLPDSSQHKASAHRRMSLYLLQLA